MKCIRIVEYEAEDGEDIKRHLDMTLLSAQPVICPGDVVPGMGPIFAGSSAPRVTIRLLDERWE